MTLTNNEVFVKKLTPMLDFPYNPGKEVGQHGSKNF